MPASNTLHPPSERIVHCDWGTKPSKCWMARAQWNGQAFRITAPEPVGELATFFTRLREGLDAEGRLFVGFDFPIGLPKAYADKVGVSNFLDALPKFGTGDWIRFFDKCRLKDEISLHRPFYPVSCKSKGDVSKGHLADALGVPITDLMRECEKKTEDRGKACELFWTLGANQAGSGAIRGWRDLLAPAIRCGDVSLGLWPFQGTLPELFKSHTTIIAETYPTEAYRHLNFPKHWKGKTEQSKRRERSVELRSWIAQRPVEIDDLALRQIIDGFGPDADGEDQFDAFLGLCSMIEVTLGHRNAGAPSPQRMEAEGWILGQSVYARPPHTERAEG